MKLLRVSVLVSTIVSMSFAADIPVVTNVDATVTFSGSGSTTEEFSAGQEKTVSLNWLNSTSNVTITAVSKHIDYLDTTYIKEMEVVNSTYEEWTSSKQYNTGDMVSHNGKDYMCGWWSQGNVPDAVVDVNPWAVIGGVDPVLESITLPRKPYSLDTAFIPVRGNVAFTITATPISMIKGENPSILTFDIPAKTDYTVKVPVRTDLSSPIVNNVAGNTKNIQFSQAGNIMELALPKNFHQGTVRVVSLMGRKIADMNLSSLTRNSTSVWNVSPGIFLLTVSSVGGEQYVQKFYHNGGDVKIATSFFNDSQMRSTRSLSTRSLHRASTAQYQFSAVPSDSKFLDSTMTMDFSGQLEDAMEFYFINPNSMASIFGQLMDSAKYEEFFPNRYGFGYGDYTDGRPIPDEPHKLSSDGDFDFYSYESLIAAIDNMAEIEVDLYQVQGHNYMHRIVWRNKISGDTREMVNNQAYQQYKDDGVEVQIGTVDYANFCNEGDLITRKQELAAFLGNISHETTAAAHNIPEKTWGLYWREEARWQKGSTDLGYVNETPNALYPPSSGQSYHGRGPIQITHNVNYGQLSEFFYGDKQILLDNPGLLVPDNNDDATVAFMSAIWFWMTPQAPKPSCHDVMVGNWIPDATDISLNRDDSKFGMTVNVINGALECNRSDDGRVSDRAHFYERYIELLGETPEADCDCADMGNVFQ